MHKVTFPERVLPLYAESVEADDLVVGSIYYSVKYLDDETLTPEMIPLTFVGPSLAKPDRMVFRECSPSYDSEGNLQDERLHRVDKKVTGVYTFDGALDELLRCSLRRHATSC